jgi:hypothetical protein
MEYGYVMITVMKRFLAIFTMTILLLHAELPQNAILEQTPDNSVLVFRSHQSHYLCRPFGVRTLEEISKDRRTNPECKKLFEGYMQRHPHSRQYAATTLKRFQRYRIEPVQDRCLLYANGRVSYSEMLLHEGVAVMKRSESRRELKRRFERAEAGARRGKRGIWQEALADECSEIAATLQGDQYE